MLVTAQAMCSLIVAPFRDCDCMKRNATWPALCRAFLPAPPAYGAEPADLGGDQSQPGRHCLQQRHIAFPPLVPGHQLDRLGRRHSEGLADRRGCGDASSIRSINMRRRMIFS